MNNLCRLLQQIEENPVAYLDEPSLTKLHSFLNGYLTSRRELGLDRKGSGMEGFQEWIEKREKINVSRPWVNIFFLFVRRESSAFNNFIRLFVEYSNLNKTSESPNDEVEISKRDDSSLHTYDIYELIERIKQKPDRYLDIPSLTRLDMYLRGYRLAKREVSIPPSEQEEEFAGFQSWIEEKYNIHSGQSWSKIILFYSIDEQEALERFFELYEEYLK